MAGELTAAGDVTSVANRTVDDLNREIVSSIVPVLVFIGILAIIGIAGNITVVLIYSNRYPKCNFKYFVLILAGIDGLSCAIVMPLEIVTFVHWFVFPSAGLCKVKSALNAFTVTASASCLLLIAIDRFKKACRPHSKQIKPELALKLTAFVLLLSLIPAASDAVFWGVHTRSILYQGTNVTATVCEKEEEFKNTIWPKLHTTVLYAGSNIVIMAATIVLYIFIARNLFCHSRPAITTPMITISPSDNENEAEMTVCKFGDNPDKNFRSPLQSISDMETGASESELSNGSDGRMSDDITIGENTDVTVDRLCIPNQEIGKRSPPILKKNAKHSLEVKDNEAPANTNKLKFLQKPEVEMRPKKGPPSLYHRQRRRSTVYSTKGHVSTKLRRKTLIMFILTITFIITTVVYLSMISHMADSGNIFKDFTVVERIVWLFFLRFYFINSVINPLLYGFLDTRFRRRLWDMGVHVRFLAGSMKRNLSESIRKSDNGPGKTEINRTCSRAKYPDRPKSSTTVSD